MRHLSTVLSGCLALVTSVVSAAASVDLTVGAGRVAIAVDCQARPTGSVALAGRIEELERDLDIAGPEGRDQRESAVLQLLAMTEPAAHAVLHKRLRRGDDLERVTRFVLARLAGRLRNPADRVFGRANSDPAQRAALAQGYISPLVDCVEQWLQSDGSTADRVEFQSALTRCLSAFDPRDRAAGFEPLLVAGGQRQLQAVRAARFTRDLGLARRLGELLDGVDEKVRGHVQRALAELTLHPQPFADSSAFRRWYEREVVEARRDFVDLAVLAWQAQREQRADLELELLVSLVRQDDPSWSRIHQALRNGGDGAASRILTGIQPDLKRRPSPGGDAAARRELLGYLLDSARARNVVEQGLCREVAAYLVDSASVGDRDMAQRVEDALLEDVASAIPDRQEPALRALQRFPCAECRKVVVAAAAGALPAGSAADAGSASGWPRPGADRVLAAALRTLAADGWTAPSPDEAEQHAAWLELLRRVLRHPATRLDQRQLAATVLTRPMATGMSSAAALSALEAEVRGADQLVELRVFALMHLHGVASQDLEGFARALTESMRPAAPVALRMRAAELIARVPIESGDEERVDQLAEAAIAQLIRESDAVVADALAEGLKRLAERHRNPDQIAAVLIGALNPADTGAEAVVAQPQIIEVVRVIVARPDCDPMLWIRAGELLVGGSLVRNNTDEVRVGLDPGVARTIVEQHPVARLIEAKVDPEWILRAHRLVVAVATHKPEGRPWAKRPEASARTLESLTALETAKLLPRDAAITLLRIELASENGNHRRALEFADQLPEASSDEGFSLALRRRAAIALARSAISREQIPTAIAHLESLAGDSAETVLVLHEALGDKYYDQKRWPDAITSYQRAFGATKPEAPPWAARLLKLARALSAADRPTDLGVLIRKHAARFATDPIDPAITDDERTAFQAIAERIRAQGGG